MLSDNGPSYVSGELAEWLEEQCMAHVRSAPNQPQTQGKIERWHQTLKNRILLENYYLPGARFIALSALDAASASIRVRASALRQFEGGHHHPPLSGGDRKALQKEL